MSLLVNEEYETLSASFTVVLFLILFAPSKPQPVVVTGVK